MKKYPNVEVKIFRGGENVGECHLKRILSLSSWTNFPGVNPKINNMVPAYKSAKYPLILVSDSGIKSMDFFIFLYTLICIFKSFVFSVKEDTLTDMVDAMKEDVGLVHQMPYTCDSVGLPSTLEKVLDTAGHIMSC